MFLFLGLGGGALSLAEQTTEHWLIGAWEDQVTGAVAKISGVQPDGTALGTMGGSLDAQRSAEIKVEGSRVRIATAVGSAIEVARKPDGTLGGTRRQSNGTVHPFTLTRMQRCLVDPLPASGQSYGPPKYCLGDTWRFADGRVQRVVRIDADSVVMTGYPMLGRTPCPECVFELDRNLTLRSIRLPDGKVPDVVAGFLPVGEEWRFWDFPLTVGKSWRISARGFISNLPRLYTIDCVVQSYEDVRTAAGTFKAFRVFRKWHWEQTQLGSEDWSDTMWFAPSVRTMVKFEQSSGPIGWELASYQPKEFAAIYQRKWVSEQTLRANGLAPLTQQQLEERYARRVEARFENTLGGRGTQSVMPDGPVHYRGGLEDTGTWRIKDGRFCTKFQKIRQGAESCFTVYRTGDWEFSYFLSDPQIAGVFIDVD